MKKLRSLHLVRHAALLCGVLSLLAVGMVPHHHHGRVPCVVVEICHAGHAARALHTAHCPHRDASSHEVCSTHVQYVRAGHTALDDASAALPLAGGACWWQDASCPPLSVQAAGGRCVLPRSVGRLAPGVFPSGGWRAPPVVC